MGTYQQHILILTKPAMRQLRDQVIESNAKALMESVNTKARKVRGWTLDVQPVGEMRPFWKKRYATGTEDAEYVYEMHLSLTFSHDSKLPENAERVSICRTIWQRASRAAFGTWTLSSVDGAEYVPPAEGEVSDSDEMLEYSEVNIPDDFEEYFSHLFGLHSHIARVRSALEAGEESGWRNRFHAVLQGPPGCGKSDICQSLKRALGNDAVMEFDATATTAAGAIKELSERDILPRIMIVEEIEKADEKALSFLLGVCDLRGEIRKTTARNTIQRDTKLLVIATVNNVALFESLQAGALASRFANKVCFKRPSRELLTKILTREIEKIKGDVRWIAPTLDYAEAHDIDDPRQMIALCLCGKGMWLTGEYQQMLADTSDPDTETLSSPV